MGVILLLIMDYSNTMKRLKKPTEITLLICTIAWVIWVGSMIKSKYTHRENVIHNPKNLKKVVENKFNISGQYFIVYSDGSKERVNLSRYSIHQIGDTITFKFIR
jgi:hypothetical protein